jgi:hypothetical protein
MFFIQLMVAAAIRKSVPRLKWVRLREKITTPVSGFVFLRGVEGRVPCARRVVWFVGGCGCLGREVMLEVMLCWRFCVFVDG